MFRSAVAASLLGLAGAAPDYAALWGQFKVDYGKDYSANGDDEQKRYEAFKANVDTIEKTNAEGLSYQLGLNEFADLTFEEFRATYLGGYRQGHNPWGAEAKEEPFPNISGLVAPNSVDWSAEGAVTPVKNQAQCGSCWAFSSTGAIEGAYFIASKKLVSLSEEDLVQCDQPGGHGCQGGSMAQAFQWVNQQGGICSEADYPYSSGGGTTGTCTKTCKPVVTVASYTSVPSNNAAALQAAVAKQPVSIAIEADQPAFQLYKSGVLTKACGTKLDHGVLVVGYGTDGGKNYWKVKNSWGATWGEKGYIRLTRDSDECGLLMQPVYPTGVKAADPSPGPSPGPTPSPSPPAPGASHYEDPKDGCQSDEVSIRIQNVKGAVCAPSCVFLIKPCPTDVPAGVTASPKCELQDASTHKTYCALSCNPSDKNDAQCGTGSCKSVQAGVGICTYDDDSVAEGTVPLTVTLPVEDIVV